MPGHFISNRPVQPNADFYRLLGARPDGVVVARYRDHDVTDVLIDEQGRRYIFAGLVPRQRDGSYDVRGLKAGEMIVDPGLIYQLIPIKMGRFN